MTFPPTYITRHLRLCCRCKEYRAVTPGCKIPGGNNRRGRFVCAGCAKSAAVTV